MNAHAQTRFGLGNHPIDVGIFNFHSAAICAKSAAFFGLAPVLIAYFKIHRAGKGFGGHGIQLQAHALRSAKLVLVVGLGFVAVFILGVLAEVAVAHAKANQPFALGFKLYGLGPPGHAHQHARCQQCDHAHFFKAVKAIPFF